MKRFFLFLVLLISSNNLKCETKQEATTLTRKDSKYHKIDSNFLKYLDGVTNRMDGSAIAEVIQVRKLIQDLQNGILEIKFVNGKQKIEYILFRGTNYSINKLCAIESEVIKKRDNETNNAKKVELNAQLEELRECLKQVRHSFIRATIKFMKRIEPAKPIVINIMKESFRIRGIDAKNTVMIEWANTNGNEQAVFNDRIKNFPDFEKFLNQVFNFLGDLLRSCPLGFAQYLQASKKS